MTTSTDFRLSLWQSVSRHLDIAESTESTANLLAANMPLQSMTTWRLDSDRQRVRVVADWTRDGGRKLPGELQLESGAWNRLQRWLRQKALLRSADDATKSKTLMASLGLSGAAGDWLLAPLV